MFPTANPTMYALKATLFFLFTLGAIHVTAFVAPNANVAQRRTRHDNTVAHLWQDDRDKEVVEEEARLRILQTRRNQIRTVLKASEGARNLRINNGWTPELDEDGKPIKSDGKLAVTLTAVAVAVGAVILRIGGRAALVSAVGLDFVNDNPELKGNLDQVLGLADSTGLATKLALFTAGWTAVKVLCFDAGGVVLALASGIIFGGVFEGAVLSSAAATFGSTVAFGMARLDTPVRKKALQVLEEFPSLRGIEKVVAKDGLKAILTLRLAPILPIPLGMYNYVYGVTNVQILDFVGGIFLGGLKPYLLDSYLGYFGKSLLDGSDGGGTQEILLLFALGASVLVGVFASQLAGETWDSVVQEVNAEKKAKVSDDGIDEDAEASSAVPKWIASTQKAFKEAGERAEDLVAVEYVAKVWNYTDADGGVPADLDPANLPGSRELIGKNQGLLVGPSVCEDLALSPILVASFFKFADPLYEEDKDDSLLERPKRILARDLEVKKSELLTRLKTVRMAASERIDKLDRWSRQEVD